VKEERVKYPWLEAIILGFGSIAIVSSMFIATGTAPQTAEVVAQLLIIIVLAGALHWGRNGGFVAAVMATGLYVALRMPLLNADGLTSDALILIGIRVTTYAVVGIVGGEIAGRLKYVLASLENTAMVDRTTGAYSAFHAAKSIESALASWHRYEASFSVVIVRIGPQLLEGLRPKRYQTTMRHIASALRGDVRLVDDIVFSRAGEFMVLLPNTETDGGAVVAERLHRLTCDALGAADSVITTEVLSCSRDAGRLAALARDLAPGDLAGSRARRDTDSEPIAAASEAQEPAG
jgi:hypothetical protein